MTRIQTICVCGAGTMGRGIAQVAARAGFNTILYELNPRVLQVAREEMNINLQSLVDKGKLESMERQAILARLNYSSDYRTCVAEFVIEAIIENADAKTRLFNQLSEINPTSIFASNTSSLSISQLAEKIENPARMIGVHFFNPAPLMKLVEVVAATGTADEVVEGTLDLCRQFGKTAVICRDSPGFIVNRVARPYYIESLRVAEEAETDFLQIDRIMEASGFRMGPFRLMDLIGNDVNLAVSQSVYEQLKHPERLKPSKLQQERVSKGELGRKTGRGYYEYR